MITLLTFGGSFGTPSHSPFCLKAMCLLNMSGQKWQAEEHTDPRKMPHGRLPVVRAGSQTIADSAHIQAFLEQQGADFNVGLSDADKARSHALVRMVEESLRLVLVHERWLNDANWLIVRDVFFGSIPGFIRKPVTNGIRKKVRAGLTSQGMAQFSDAERVQRSKLDITSIMTQLGNQPFLFGPNATAADAAIVPVLDMLLNLPTDTGPRRLVREWPGIQDYVARGRSAMYPE